MKLRAGPFLIAVLVAACAAPEPAQEPVVASAPAAKPQAEAAVRPARPIATVPKAGKPAPIPTRPLNVVAECSFRDEDGYNGNLKLAVEEAKVLSFEASVNIPRHGTCRFDLKNFRQTRLMPNVVLSHLHGPCVVYVWEQGERVTVAYQHCQKMCSGKAWEHLWPILADRRDGSCG